MTKFKTAIAVAVGSLFAGAAFAQSNFSIEQRDRAEQGRIERGIESGQLTGREAARLQGERGQIERMERRARADGVMTQYERARIDHAQDRLSRDISRESHDRQTAGSNWRNSDRSNAWDRRSNNHYGHTSAQSRGWDNRFGGEHAARPGQFNRGDGVRGERFGSHLNGVPTRTGTDARFGRSDMSPGRQPHVQQSTTQSTRVEHAQSQRTWNRPARAATPAVTAGTATPTSPAVSTRTTSATRTTRTATSTRPVTVARAGGFSGRHTR